MVKLDIHSLHSAAKPGTHIHQSSVNRHLKTLMDIGDIVGVKGPMKRTDKGELSIVAEDLQVCLDSTHELCICKHSRL